MYKRLAIMIVVLLLIFGGIFGWKAYTGRQMAAQFKAPPPPATVASAEVQAEVWQSSLQAVGSLVATQDIDVTTEVAGQVSAIPLRSGEYVKAGELLLELDDSVDQAELAGLQAEFKLAELNFARMDRLYQDDKKISQSDHDLAQALLEKTRALVAAKQALIGKKKIRAPFAGYLGIRQVNLGQYLAPGSPIVLLQKLNPIHGDFSLPERNMAELALGLAVELQVQSRPGRSFTGRVTAINPGLDAQTRNIRVRATLDNPKGELRPGMFADMRILLPAKKQALTLPQTAVMYAPYGNSVFVITGQDKELTIQRRQVKTGAVRGNRIEIIEGLAAGEQVVSTGQVKLRNDQKVILDNSVDLGAQAIGP
ncbi:MAG: efflux transporter periplasmic adaptor subunit [Gammaproteobacteria bacterium RBG_16_57_12]|nr:MAG: efflux transporter periplasmic adaptor subunit [Gammaproteobacteria bacterium RBG_16_57_12]